MKLEAGMDDYDQIGYFDLIDSSSIRLLWNSISIKYLLNCWSNSINVCFDKLWCCYSDSIWLYILWSISTNRKIVHAWL